MDNFREFLSNRGIDNVEELESFLNEFITDPALFFNLTVIERNDFESKMDAAFLLLEKIEKPDQNALNLKIIAAIRAQVKGGPVGD